LTFHVETIETSSLGDRSYIATDGGLAVVIDPQRDIDRVLSLVDRLGVRITHVLETHVHNDYVTGGLELAKSSGALYVLPVGSEVDFDHRPAVDGEVITTGAMRLRPIHTPGHTHHHFSYALEGRHGDVQAVFSGGSMLYGATGRTDLVGPEHTDGLTHAQYHSVRRLARELPGDTQVFPTHGFGSFCSATPTSGDASTVEEQARVNPALTLAEQDYVDTLLAGLDAFPAYYARMGPINRQGPEPVDLSTPTYSIRVNCGDASKPVSGWQTCASALPLLPDTCRVHWALSCPPTLSPTWAGCTATALLSPLLGKVGNKSPMRAASLSASASTTSPAPPLVTSLPCPVGSRCARIL